MAAGSAGEGAGSNTELRWTFSRLACQSELALALKVVYTAVILCELFASRCLDLLTTYTQQHRYTTGAAFRKELYTPHNELEGALEKT